ncbi:hypothetical protein ACIBSW_07390 [Actinoplanes sp. NPDC049668]|uniref:hypothetical protein n=1 Tax=unclassified Actinoplanes TaxID=2626549 RepID=UPI0033A528FE
MSSDLAECLGTPPPEDPGDEHQRWALYRRAISREACHPPLLAALHADPDDGLVASVVIQMMEWVEASQREPWIASVRTDRDRRYATRRGREVDILRIHGAVPDLGQASVTGWTDWLQIRLAEISTVAPVLDLLALHGRTKRIRRTAAQRRIAR